MILSLQHVLLSSFILSFLHSASHSYSFNPHLSKSSFAVRVKRNEQRQQQNQGRINYTFNNEKKHLVSISARKASSLSSYVIMRDLSSANIFQVGDQVQVVSSVVKAGVDLIGRVGTVQETWEKCDVDPTCCCAEFVDENFAVTVKFEGSIRDTNSNIDISNSNDGDMTDKRVIPSIGLNDYFIHFFSEEELIHAQSTHEFEKQK